MSQCWAYSAELDRCDQNAGHEGPHSVTMKWDDEAVFVPVQNLNKNLVPVQNLNKDNDWVHPEGGEVRQVPVISIPMRDEQPVTSSSTNPQKCFACTHRWHTSTCPVVKDDLECGCSKALA